ncbi:hypothetical protein BC938DRAFT_472648 [Jimgerdemannia flammicorona]|uniref:P-loop containing nucleoside triphosphate hydrolase protein n=1 Tax=Jimgerdemannia flammicorona TaxID=994334 RepID=A0A433Q5N1_9FUNG|nr:hypothetical protein BC938DRAFT_472648 [Jimgerdemannia flammicorona]
MKESTASDPIAMDCSEDTDSPWYAETSSVSGPTKADPVHPMCTSSIPACARLIGQLRIMIVGDSCVGKTQFAHRLLREIELAFGSKTEIRSGDTYSLMGGLPELRQDAPPFEMTEYRASTAYTTLWPVVSDNGHTSLPNASSWLSKSAPVYSVTVLDTRGYGETTNAVEAMTRVTTYLEQAFVNTQAIYASSTPHHNFYRLLSPGFGIHELVDVVLYLSHAIKPVDIVYMRRLKPFACVVPVSVVDGIAEPLVIEEERAQVRKRFEEFGVTWSERKGMIFHERLDAQFDNGNRMDRMPDAGCARVAIFYYLIRGSRKFKVADATKTSKTRCYPL